METLEIIDRAEISGDKVIVQYSQTEAALSSLRDKYQGIVYDLTTTAGDKAARAARMDLVSLRTSLEKKRKEFKAPALEFGKKIDSEAARITAEIVALEKPIDDQIKADEARRAAEKAERDRIEAERVQTIKNKIAYLRSFVARCSGISSERIAAGIKQVEQLEINSDGFFEFTVEAIAAKIETLKEMETLYDVAIEKEAEAARIEAQRIENEKIAEQQKKQAEILAEEFRKFKEKEEAAKAMADELAAKQAEIDRQAEQLRKEKELIESEKSKQVEICQHQPKEQKPFDPQIASLESAEKMMTLGAINEKIGFILNSAFMSEIGFDAVILKNARLYKESDMKSICQAISRHVLKVAGL